MFPRKPTVRSSHDWNKERKVQNLGRCKMQKVFTFPTVCSSMLMRFYTYPIIILLSSCHFWVQARPIYAMPGIHSQLLRRLVIQQRIKPFFELFNSHLLTGPMLHATVNSLRWDEHIAHNMNDAI